MFLNILMFPVLFLVGIVTSYEDIRYGKITNRWIIFGIVWGFCVLTVLLLLNLFGKIDIVSIEYAKKVMLNFLVVAVLSFLMWKFGVWAAGDAKLFITFSILLPLTFYQKSYLPIFPSFVLLINIFALVSLYMVVMALIFYGEKIWTEKGNFFKNAIIQHLQIRSFFQKRLGFIIGITVIFLTVAIIEKTLFEYFLAKVDLKMVLSLLFIIMTPFNKFLRRVVRKTMFLKIAVSVILIGLFIFSLTFDFSSTVETIWRASLMIMVSMIVFGLFKSMINFYVRQTNMRKTVPFATWIFAGVILTLFLKSSVINVILNIVFS